MVNEIYFYTSTTAGLVYRDIYTERILYRL